MIRRLLIGWALSLLTGCSEGAVVGDPDTPESIIARAKVAVADKLSDPDAARFRDVKALREEPGQKSDSSGRWTICGQVNGKNLMGGYVGYRPFRSHIYDDGDIVVVVRGSDLDDNRWFDANYKVGCEGENPSIIEKVADEQLREAQAELHAVEEDLHRLQGD